MKNKLKNNKAGFVEFIVIIIVALLLMKYFHITVSTVVMWVKAFIAWFTAYFHDILK